MDARRWAETDDVEALVRFAYTSAHAFTDDGSTRTVRARQDAYMAVAEEYAMRTASSEQQRRDITLQVWLGKNWQAVDNFVADRPNLRRKMADAARATLGRFELWTERAPEERLHPSPLRFQFPRT